MLKNGDRKARMVVISILLLQMLAGCARHDKTDQAMQLVAASDHEGALAVFQEARAAGENERLITRGEGIAHLGLGELDQAIDCFSASLSGSDGWVRAVDYDVNYYLAAAYMKKGQYDEAKEIYDAILVMNPNEEDAYLLRGKALLELSQDQLAQSDFEQVILRDPTNYDRLILIYRILETYGHHDIGITYLQRAIDSSDRKKMNAYDKGRIYYHMGAYQEACTALETMKGKGGAESILYLGRSYEALGEYQYAKKVYSNYLEKDQTNAQVYNQLGLCQMSQQDYRAALEAFQTGQEVADNGLLQTLCFNEIVAYEYLGEYQRALLLLQNYLENYPDDAKAQREWKFLHTR